MGRPDAAILASTLLGLILVGLPSGHLQAQPGAVEEIQGAPMFTVLPRDAIPAIDDPIFVNVQEAEKFMRPEEQVLGVTDAGGKVARAYSTWQLNQHEIVNDVVGGTPLAITW